MNPRLDPLTHLDIAATRDLIADVVLELYPDLYFLPKTRDGLLEYYDRTGYLDDIAAFESVYEKENGAFLVLKDPADIHGCGGIRRLDASRGDLVRLWLKKELRGMGYGRLIFDLHPVNSIYETGTCRSSRSYLKVVQYTLRSSWKR